MRIVLFPAGFYNGGNFINSNMFSQCFKNWPPWLGLRPNFSLTYEFDSGQMLVTSFSPTWQRAIFKLISYPMHFTFEPFLRYRSMRDIVWKYDSYQIPGRTSPEGAAVMEMDMPHLLLLPGEGESFAHCQNQEYVPMGQYQNCKLVII